MERRNKVARKEKSSGEWVHVVWYFSQLLIHHESSVRALADTHTQSYSSESFVHRSRMSLNLEKKNLWGKPTHIKKTKKKTWKLPWQGWDLNPLSRWAAVNLFVQNPRQCKWHCRCILKKKVSQAWIGSTGRLLADTHRCTDTTCNYRLSAHHSTEGE